MVNFSDLVAGIGVRDGKAGSKSLAESLLQQSQATRNPLVAALTGFVGGSALQNISNLESEKATAEAKRQAEIDAKKLGFEESKLGLEQEKLGILKGEAAKKAQKIDAEIEKLNKEASGDALGVQLDQQTGNKLLFKGDAPVTSGLEKGMQWAISPEGQRTAVPIPAQPSEKAKAIKDATKSVVGRLLNNKSGVKANFGALDRFTPNLRESALEAQTDINQLRSLLTVDNLSLMSGVLSETDIKILQNVLGGQIAETATEGQVINALNKMATALGIEEGNGKGGKNPPPPPTLGGGFKILSVE